VRSEAFINPAYAAVHKAVEAAGGPPAEGSKAAWVETVSGQLPAGPLRSLVSELAVEPPRHRFDAVDSRYAGAILARMAERVAATDERRLYSMLQRAEATGDKDKARSLSADLSAVALYRRALAERASEL
jgi:DNA primase